ncbi:MAG TPA: Gfo/Idh/MocA family oxidoreductase [Phototrophicaceae bacterium]|jgi:predicted dehydrogenase|nr:Gfo/Idh/MocA family oxidoreductase [Phototrophicaceae bacterium]
MNQVRIAIIGTGNSVGNHISAITAAEDRVALVAAVDTNEARVKAFCEEHHIPRYYTSVQDLLAAETVDLVHIVTPPSTHKDLTITCLEAGAWVYCEKPLCASLAEFDAIAEAEQRTGRYVSTVFQWRFGSAGKHLKHLIETRALGKPLVAVCNTLWYRPHTYYAVEWRGHWATEVGGPTMTLGIHLMDLCLWLMDEWEEVRAMAGTLDRDIEVEDVSMALVRFAGGAMGSIVNSALSPNQTSQLRVDFQKATVEVNALYRYTNEHWQVNLPPNVVDPDIVALWNTIETDLPSSHEVQLREILDAMEQNQRPPVSGDEARRILEFTTSLYKSAFTGQPVLRGEITPDDPYYRSMHGASAAEVTRS